MRTKVYTSFEALPASYGPFFEQFEKKDFFASPSWFNNFSRTALEPGVGVRLYAVEAVSGDEVRPLGLLALRNPAGQNGSVFRGWRLMGRTLASMTSHQSISFAPLIAAEGDTAAVSAALAKAVRADHPAWAMVDLNFFDGHPSVPDALARGFRAQGMAVRHYTYAVTVYENVAGISYADYLTRRPSKVRKTYPRMVRKLERETQSRFHLVTDPTELDHAVADYQAVLDESWKDPEPFPQHTAGVMQAAARAGTLRLGLLYVDDKPVATQLWILAEGRVTIYKIHYDLAFKHLSVGSILTLKMLRHAIDVDHVAEVNFGIGGEAHKRNWLAEERPVQGMVAFNPRSPSGLLLLIAFSSRSYLATCRQALKRLLMTLKGWRDLMPLPRQWKTHSS